MAYATLLVGQKNLILKKRWQGNANSSKKEKNHETLVIGSTGFNKLG